MFSDQEFIPYIAIRLVVVGATFLKLRTNILKIRNWRTLLHRRSADVSCSPTRWQHFSE